MTSVEYNYNYVLIWCIICCIVDLVCWVTNVKVLYAISSRLERHFKSVEAIPP